MIYTTHVLFAVLLTLLIEKSLHISILFPKSILFLSLGSLLPDIDHPSSYISRKSWRVLLLSKLAPKHRSWTHSILGAVVLTLLFNLIRMAYGLDSLYTYLFFLGYVSHLISDSLNPSGVAWFWPETKRYGFNLIKTGSISEMFFQAALISLILIFGYHYHYLYYYNLLE